MGVFLLVFVIVGVLLAAMSIGVIFGGKPIAGTCGGIGALGLDGACDICGGDTRKCEEENQRLAGEGKTAELLAYDATAADRR
ncbi:(Na+)-NQR maturation NqrM [Marinobacter sp. X15-166B]|uniref:(Na+)-NQR maturation NqrM n=1 Tax=Marinobacter sp. X15-166B TaxID=1897620 RepID=UPI00085C08B8|nr:(Na+)-NQR maturation NqrM [Marinobacter sp. X15-166B]OEY67123.1 ApbE family protein [Marinobacter sp. X15-166B]